MDQTFLELLKSQHEWPTDYLYKFVVPQDKLQAFLDHLDLKDYEEKQSSTGKYISLTFTWTMTCAEDVIKVYQKAAEIEGVLSL